MHNKNLEPQRPIPHPLTSCRGLTQMQPQFFKFLRKLQNRPGGHIRTADQLVFFSHGSVFTQRVRCATGKH